MTAPTPLAPETAADRNALAKLKQDQREAGIRGKGVQEGREQREREILAQLGAQTIDEVGLLPSVQAAFDAALDRVRHEHRHDSKRSETTGYWRGLAHGGVTMLLLGVAGGAAIALATTEFNLQRAFDAATEAQERAAFTGAAIAGGRREP